MTMPSTPVAPIIALGPCGSTFLSVDPTVDEALDHLSDHGAHDPPPWWSRWLPRGHGRPRIPGDITFFDTHGRRLHLQHANGGRRFVLADADADHRGEVIARVEEMFAHVRELAYRAPTPPDGIEPAHVRAPEAPALPHSSTATERDDAFEEFVAVLCRRMSYQQQTDQDVHAGSWWHNVFHRFG